MSYRVQWTPSGTPFPEFRDFDRRLLLAENYAAIMRELGHEHISTHEVDGTCRNEAATGARGAEQGAPGVVGPDEDGESL